MKYTELSDHSVVDEVFVIVAHSNSEVEDFDKYSFAILSILHYMSEHSYLMYLPLYSGTANVKSLKKHWHPNLPNIIIE